MTIYFILVEPKLPENIGAAARAMKTMGFEYLRLINSADHLSERATWMAHGSRDILEKAVVHPDLKTAISDLDITIGTTTHHRLIRKQYIPCGDLFNIIQNKLLLLKKIGILFGREDRGLLNDELKQCDLVSAIPVKIKFPSLNLAQAVMVYAYCLSPLIGMDSGKEKMKSPAESLGVFKKWISRFLNARDIPCASSLHQQAMERIGTLSEKDVRLLYAVFNKLEKI